MKGLLGIEAQVLVEGREWMRQQLERRLQAEADKIGAICPQSGLVLKYVQLREFSLMTTVGTVTVRAAYGYSTHMQRWVSPAREEWDLAPYERVSPQLQARLCYTATQTGSYQKAALLAAYWGTPVSDDLVHSQVQRIGLEADQQVVPAASTGEPKNEAPFSLAIMLDGWMARERGPQWAAPSDCQDAQRVAWHEVKSGVIYRLDHRAQTASGRGVLTQKTVVACPPGTDVVEFGATVQKEALRCGMARAQEVFVVVDGAVWLWSLIEDRFSGATQTLDFYHASQRLWELAHYLHPNDAQDARSFVEPLLHQLRHGESSRVITRLEEILPKTSLHDDSADPQLQRQIQYFLNHRDHLNYQAVAERRAPIGSGAVESQCSQFQDRFKRTGQFWTRPGLSNLLALHVMAQNKTFAYLWN
jgi:hypothetical protein